MLGGTGEDTGIRLYHEGAVSVPRLAEIAVGPNPGEDILCTKQRGGQARMTDDASACIVTAAAIAWINYLQ